MGTQNRTPICPYADTAENLEFRNDVLVAGQKVYDLTNKKYKTGDGVTKWNDLNYDSNSSLDSNVLNYKGSVDYYQDLPENAIVGDVYKIENDSSTGFESGFSEKYYFKENASLSFGDPSIFFLTLLVNNKTIDYLESMENIIINFGVEVSDGWGTTIKKCGYITVPKYEQSVNNSGWEIGDFSSTLDIHLSMSEIGSVYSFIYEGDGEVENNDFEALKNIILNDHNPNTYDGTILESQYSVDGDIQRGYDSNFHAASAGDLATKIDDGWTVLPINTNVYTKEQINSKKANIDLSNVSNEDFKSKAEAAGVGGNDVSDSIQRISDLETHVESIDIDLDKLLVVDDEWTNEEIIISTDGYYGKDGIFYSTSNRAYSIITNVQEGERYRLKTYLSSTLIPAIVYFNSDNCIGYERLGTGKAEVLEDYEFVIPSNCNKFIIQNANYPNYELKLEKHMSVKSNASYTKLESDDRFCLKYGVKWAIDDVNDLGQRCFASLGLSAKIGVGDKDGYSDFDDIYPWSEIKRCNIKTNINGASIVTYEGEDGFALDGSNGDVFVRIPKFTIERYIKDGYEYRVIGSPNAPVHEAFVENEKILDEIFIGAFEGYIDTDSKLRSFENVIPTNNEIPETFLTNAKSNGENYSLYDMRSVDAIWTLMAVEYGCRNTNQIIGYGLADFMQPSQTVTSLFVVETATNTNSVKIAKMSNSAKLTMPIGTNITICDTNQHNIIAQRKIINVEDTSDDLYTIITFDGDGIDVNSNCFVGSAPCITNFCELCSNSLVWHTGRANFINNSTTRNPIRYRWIENIVGNVWHFLPDITFNNLQMYVCKDMDKYQFHKYSDEYVPIGNVFTKNLDNGAKADVVDKNYWIDNLLNDTFSKGTLMGKSYNKELTSVQAFGAYYYMADTIVCIANGGGFDHLYRCNMLTQRATIPSDGKWFLYGARLMFKKIR